VDRDAAEGVEGHGQRKHLLIGILSQDVRQQERISKQQKIACGQWIEAVDRWYHKEKLAPPPDKKENLDLTMEEEWFKTELISYFDKLVNDLQQQGHSVGEPSKNPPATRPQQPTVYASATSGTATTATSATRPQQPTVYASATSGTSASASASSASSESASATSKWRKPIFHHIVNKMKKPIQVTTAMIKAVINPKTKVVVLNEAHQLIPGRIIEMKRRHVIEVITMLFKGECFTEGMTKGPDAAQYQVSSQMQPSIKFTLRDQFLDRSQRLQEDQLNEILTFTMTEVRDEAYNNAKTMNWPLCDFVFAGERDMFNPDVGGGGVLLLTSLTNTLVVVLFEEEWLKKNH